MAIRGLNASGSCSAWTSSSTRTNRLLTLAQRLDEARNDDIRDARARGGERIEDPRVDRLDPVQAMGDRGNQERRVVVPVVERDPGEWPLGSAASHSERTVVFP